MNIFVSRICYPLYEKFICLSSKFNIRKRAAKRVVRRNGKLSNRLNRSSGIWPGPECHFQPSNICNCLALHACFRIAISFLHQDDNATNMYAFKSLTLCSIIFFCMEIFPYQNFRLSLINYFHEIKIIEMFARRF